MNHLPGGYRKQRLGFQVALRIRPRPNGLKSVSQNARHHTTFAEALPTLPCQPGFLMWVLALARLPEMPSIVPPSASSRVPGCAAATPVSATVGVALRRRACIG